MSWTDLQHGLGVRKLLSLVDLHVSLENKTESTSARGELNVTLSRWTERGLKLTLKYCSRSLQVIFTPPISFSTRFSGDSSVGTRFTSSFLKSSSISETATVRRHHNSTSSHVSLHSRATTKHHGNRAQRVVSCPVCWSVGCRVSVSPLSRPSKCGLVATLRPG